MTDPAHLNIPNSNTATISRGIDDEPNPPIWPETVKLFRDTDDADWILAELEATQDPYVDDSFTCDHHFDLKRFALLFAPGTYRDVRVQVGYYVQVAGLGRNAHDVTFVGSGKVGPYVPALNKHLHHRVIKATTNEEGVEHHVREPVGTCLDSFWRSAENFATEQDLHWAVSQAAPLRRVHIGNGGSLHLHDGPAYASGGHLANAHVDGNIYAGGQQQYLLRNVHVQQEVVGGAWSIVQAGCTTSNAVATATAAASTGSSVNSTNVLVDDPDGHQDLNERSRTAKVTLISEPRVRIEKPYISMKHDLAQFELRIPKAHWCGEDASYTIEPMLTGRDDDDVRDFARVRVVRADEPIGRIQEALDEGKDVVLAPGIFALEHCIELRRPNQVLMGLGFATVEAPPDGSPCIRVAPGLPGVRIVSIMLEATETSTSCNNESTTVQLGALLEWGTEDCRDPGSKNNPGAMFDVFVRVGGATTGNRTKFSVPAMMRIHSGHVIGDNLWLWRADHALLGPDEAANYPHISSVFWQSEQDEYRVETGIEVFGDDVTMYGLAVEHANGHQTLWCGERGAVHFYQCEFPYGVDRRFAEEGFRGYLVKDHVTDHNVYAPGIYSNFRNDDVFVSTAMEYPEKAAVRVVNPFTVKLDNRGGILSIANGKGNAADKNGIPVYLT